MILAKIGIFWVYRHQVFGQTCALDAAEMGVSGRLDSPDTHDVVWPAVAALLGLAHLDYIDVPRGRVLFDLKRQCAVIYVDQSLLSQKALIRGFFGLTGVPVIWRLDLHYTIDSKKITEIFDD